MNKIDYQKVWNATNIEFARTVHKCDAEWNRIYERILHAEMAKAGRSK